MVELVELLLGQGELDAGEGRSILVVHGNEIEAEQRVVVVGGVESDSARSRQPRAVVERFGSSLPRIAERVAAIGGRRDEGPGRGPLIKEDRFDALGRGEIAGRVGAVESVEDPPAGGIPGEGEGELVAGRDVSAKLAEFGGVKIGKDPGAAQLLDDHPGAPHNQVALDFLDLPAPGRGRVTAATPAGGLGNDG